MHNISSNLRSVIHMANRTGTHSSFGPQPFAETPIRFMAVVFCQRTAPMVDSTSHAISRMVLPRALLYDFGWYQDVTDMRN